MSAPRPRGPVCGPAVVCNCMKNCEAPVRVRSCANESQICVRVGIVVKNGSTRSCGVALGHSLHVEPCGKVRGREESHGIGGKTAGAGREASGWAGLRPARRPSRPGWRRTTDCAAEGPDRPGWPAGGRSRTAPAHQHPVRPPGRARGRPERRSTAPPARARAPGPPSHESSLVPGTRCGGHRPLPAARAHRRVARRRVASRAWSGDGWAEPGAAARHRRPGARARAAVPPPERRCAAGPSAPVARPPPRRATPARARRHRRVSRPGGRASRRRAAETWRVVRVWSWVRPPARSGSPWCRAPASTLSQCRRRAIAPCERPSPAPVPSHALWSCSRG